MRAHPLPDIIVSTTTQLCAEETKPNYVLLIIQQLAGVGGGKRTYLHELFIYIMYIFLSWQIYQPNITELRAGKRCARSTLVSLVSLWELTAHHWKNFHAQAKKVFQQRETTC